MHRTDKYSQHSSIIWPAWPNGWVFVYKLSGYGFESSCSYLNFRFWACFEQRVPWHSINYRVWIHSETCMWHDKNIQSNASNRSVLTTELNHLVSLAKWLGVCLAKRLAKWLGVRLGQMVVGSNPPNAITYTSDFMPASRKEFPEIKATTDCGFTLKCQCNMIRTYSQVHRTDKYSQHSSIIWPARPNSLVFAYELSGCGFESSWCHIITIQLQSYPMTSYWFVVIKIYYTCCILY